MSEHTIGGACGWLQYQVPETQIYVFVFFIVALKLPVLLFCFLFLLLSSLFVVFCFFHVIKKCYRMFGLTKRAQATEQLVVLVFLLQKQQILTVVTFVAPVFL